MKSIAIGSDLYGKRLKEVLQKYLIDAGYEVSDYGVQEAPHDDPYYVVADKVSTRICEGRHDKAVLVCGTGMGMAIIANKYPGIYAAVCESPIAARYARSINNSNVLTLGCMLTTDTVAQEIVDVWLNTGFTEDWDKEEQDWLTNSMDEISKLEKRLFAK